MKPKIMISFTNCNYTLFKNSFRCKPKIYYKLTANHIYI